MEEAVERDGRHPGLVARRDRVHAGLDGNLRRAIDFREGDTINEKALKALVNAAVKLNNSDRD